MRTAFIHLVLCAACNASAMAQTSPARGPIASAAVGSASDEQQLADYLGLLQQIAPAAAEATRTYRSAVQLRCGQALDTATLRRLLAREGGDPVLQGLIRAAATQDAGARQRLLTQLPCPIPEAPR